MNIILSILALMMSSCSFTSFGSEGEEVIYDYDISGVKKCEFKASLSSEGRLTFQQIRISVEGREVKRSNLLEQIVVEMFVENLATSGEVQFSDNDFIVKRFDAVKLQPRQTKKIHRSLLLRASGKSYFDVRVSRLTNNSIPIKFSIKFSKPMPAGTQITAKVLWADGP